MSNVMEEYRTCRLAMASLCLSSSFSLKGTSRIEAVREFALPMLEEKGKASPAVVAARTRCKTKGLQLFMKRHSTLIYVAQTALRMYGTRLSLSLSVLLSHTFTGFPCTM